jgi:hypothetical protein
MSQKSNPSYTKVCTLIDLFEDHGARHSMGTQKQEEKKANQRELIERLASQTKQEYVILTPDIVDHHGTVQAFVWNSRDSLLTMVINDDNGHTAVVQDMESLKEFDEEMQLEGFDPKKDGLWLGTASDHKRKLDNVFAKYRRGHGLDAFAMVDRLVELGEGD